ncbi:MAG: aminotransferase class V-fold PLP-dependent enzyme [Rhodospirillales bacterium]|nr:aminotransferase class V-fold PLP-dependent enzyme [Rhodospirillales bacterium]
MKSLKTGRHFLQIPGPTNLPHQILRAIDRPTVDHRGAKFGEFASDVLERLKKVFKTKNPVVIYPSSGTGAWEAALTNTLSPGDKVLMFETGQFAYLWQDLAKRIGLDVIVHGDHWRTGVPVDEARGVLAKDKNHEIKAVCMVHNETATGVVSDVEGMRKAMDDAGHPALLLVDTISSLGSLDFRFDDWGVDVAIGGSQKGLMLPAGLGFNAISDKALEANKTSKLPCCYFAWQDMLNANKDGFFPYTPAANLLFGLDVAIDMLFEEGLDNVFARHERYAGATRAAVKAWGMETVCQAPGIYSPSITAIYTPEGHNSDAFRKVVLDNFDMSLGTGLARLQGKVFRIGHLGSFNELMMMGTLSGVEMGMELAGMPHEKGGVDAAMAFLTSSHAAENTRSAAE